MNPADVEVLKAATAWAHARRAAMATEPDASLGQSRAVFDHYGEAILRLEQAVSSMLNAPRFEGTQLAAHPDAPREPIRPRSLGAGRTDAA